MASRKEQGGAAKGSSAPRVRRSRTSVRETHYRSPQSDPASTPHQSAMTARDWYQREKARREGKRTSPAETLVEEARQEFLAMLAAEAGTARGGRPKKNAAPKRALQDDDVDLGETGEHPAPGWNGDAAEDEG